MSIISVFFLKKENKHTPAQRQIQTHNFIETKTHNFIETKIHNRTQYSHTHTQKKESFLSIFEPYTQTHRYTHTHVFIALMDTINNVIPSRTIQLTFTLLDPV